MIEIHCDKCQKLINPALVNSSGVKIKMENMNESNKCEISIYDLHLCGSCWRKIFEIIKSNKEI